MTPLAYSVAKENWLPEKRRRFQDKYGILEFMDDVRCFEVSEVFELADELGEKWYKEDAKSQFLSNSIDTTFAFLPAEKTWIEWREGPARVAVLLLNCKDDGQAFATIIIANQKYFGSVDTFVLKLHDNENFEIRIYPDSPFNPATQAFFQYRLYAFLALINSPSVIGRQQHAPHKALQKEARAQGIGNVPEWTLLQLHVAKPADLDDGEAHEEHLTGRRALHFCRAFVRIRLGKLEYVRAHWRGDEARGVREKTYMVTR
jgi:hypothetical protein